MTNKPNGTLYIGHTEDLVNRVWQHKKKETPGFTRKYNLTNLVWYDVFERRDDAKDFETRMKRWRRAWKIDRIEEHNPDWIDLTYTL